MFDAERLLGSLLRAGVSGGRGRRGRGLGNSLGRAAFSPQGLTILGGIAVAAYDHFQQKKGAGTSPGMLGATPPPVPSGATPPPPPPGFAPDEAQALSPEQRKACLLIEAMINAAKCDGTVDAEERTRILGQLEQSELGERERAFVNELMTRPFDLESVVRQATDPMTAAEVYAASYAAIVEDSEAEKGYLALLAGRLGIDVALAAELRQKVNAARDPA